MAEWFVRYGSDNELHGPYINKDKAVEAVTYEMTVKEKRYATFYTLHPECAMRAVRSVEFEPETEPIQKEGAHGK